MRTNVLAAALLATFVSFPVTADSRQSAAPPDLVVVISIDQFPSEYIERFGPHFHRDGAFLRLLNGGTSWTHARYEFAAMKTGPGHASIGSGLPPSRHGIVSNDWYDRHLQETIYCAEDQRSALTEGKGTPVSPINLAEDALADRVRQKYPASKIIGLSDKDRAAILMAGKRADAAYWFDDGTGHFVSSDYYRFDPQVLKFNERLPSYLDANRSWRESGLISEAALEKITYDPPELREYKTNAQQLGVSFPHPIGSYAALAQTPFGNDLLLDFAQHTIDVSKMGQRDGSPDLLFIGLSATDDIGHSHGPDSREIADAFLRLDRSLGKFLTWLDGLEGSVVVALTADHGIQPIPEVARARGKKGGRLSFARASSATTIGESKPLRKELELRVAKRLGINLKASSAVDEAVIESVEVPNFYLNWNRILRGNKKLQPARVRQIVAEELEKFEGVSEAFTSDELLALNPHAGETEKAARLSFRADRSGDVVVYFREGYISSGNLTGTNHGQPVEADQVVPLMFWGDGVASRKPSGAASPLDLVSTLAPLLGVRAGEPGRKPLDITKSE